MIDGASMSRCLTWGLCWMKADIVSTRRWASSMFCRDSRISSGACWFSLMYSVNWSTTVRSLACTSASVSPASSTRVIFTRM